MEMIKRKISLEDIISRNSDGTYGTITGDSFYTKIYLTQSADDMGIATDLDYVKNPLSDPKNGGNIDFEPGFVIIHGKDVCTR